MPRLPAGTDTTLALECVMHGSGMNVLPHFMAGAVVRHWRSSDVHIDTTKIHATSSGSLCAAVILCTPEADWAEIGRFVHDRLATDGLRQTPAIVEAVVSVYFQPDAYTRADGRLHVYYHRLGRGGWTQVCHSAFTSNAELCRAITRSTALPGITHTSLCFDDQGRLCLDGGVVPPLGPVPPHAVRLVSGPDDARRLLSLRLHQFTLPRTVPSHLAVPPVGGSTVRTYRHSPTLRLAARFWYTPLVAIAAVVALRRLGAVGFIESVLPWLPPVLSGLLARELAWRRRPAVLFGLLVVGYGLRVPAPVARWLARRYATPIAADGPLPGGAAAYLLGPHGATTFGASRLCARLLQEHGRRPNLVAASMLRWVPGASLLISMFARPAWSTPAGVRRAAADLSRPLVVYPGGVSEVFHNAARGAPATRLPMGPRLAGLLARRACVQAWIHGESSVYFHPRWIVWLFRLVHTNVARVGVPLPAFMPGGLPAHAMSITVA